MSKQKSWTLVERSALRLLAKKQGLTVFGVQRQALRLYQQHCQRLEAGETCTWSGDAQRAREFAGPTTEESNS